MALRSAISAFMPKETKEIQSNNLIEKIRIRRILTSRKGNLERLNLVTSRLNLFTDIDKMKTTMLNSQVSITEKAGHIFENILSFRNQKLFFLEVFFG